MSGAIGYTTPAEVERLREGKTAVVQGERSDACTVAVRLGEDDAAVSAVKALEWSEAGGSTALGLSYHVWLTKDAAQGYREIWLAALMQGGRESIGTFSSKEKAQAACQADFERRVLSCLSPVAVEEADAKAERKGHTPSDEEMDEATIRQRDIAEDAADKLAEAIGELLGVNVGEHSSAHSPWETALEHAGQAVRNRALSTHTATGAGPVGEAVAVPYDDFLAAYGFVPRSQMYPRSCLKSRLRDLLRPEDVAHADEAESYAARPVWEPGEAVADARDEGWQPIETAPTGGKFGCFLMLAFGPPGDQTVSEGMHFQGRFYAASVFYTGGPHDTKQFTFREHEVKPTHWRHTLAAPGAARPVEEPGEVERLRAEGFALAANQCRYGYGDEHGHHRCAEIDRLTREIFFAKTALVETQERLENERDAGFNHGYLMAVANIINLHRETVVAADVLLQIDLTIDDAEAFELAEYDMEALNRLRAEPRAADFFKSQRRTGDAQEPSR